MNKTTKTLLAALFLVAYLAVLLKLIVFKDLTFSVSFLHFHIPSGRVPGRVHYNYVPFKTIGPYLLGYPRWRVAIGNLLGNIILFMPLGFLLPLLYRPISWKGVLGI